MNRDKIWTILETGEGEAFTILISLNVDAYKYSSLFELEFNILTWMSCWNNKMF